MDRALCLVKFRDCFDLDRRSLAQQRVLLGPCALRLVGRPVACPTAYECFAGMKRIEAGSTIPFVFLELTQRK